jgi:hypothetical protein
VTFYNFHLLSSVVQLYWVLKHGTSLAQRWQAERGVNLYHCGDVGHGFFNSSALLAKYAHWLRLPEK